MLGALVLAATVVITLGRIAVEILKGVRWGPRLLKGIEDNFQVGCGLFAVMTIGMVALVPLGLLLDWDFGNLSWWQCVIFVLGGLAVGYAVLAKRRA